MLCSFKSLSQNCETKLSLLMLGTHFFRVNFSTWWTLYRKEIQNTVDTNPRRVSRPSNLGLCEISDPGNCAKGFLVISAGNDCILTHQSRHYQRGTGFGTVIHFTCLTWYIWWKKSCTTWYILIEYVCVWTSTFTGNQSESKHTSDHLRSYHFTNILKPRFF